MLLYKATLKCTDKLGYVGLKDMKTIWFTESLCKGASAFDRIARLQEQIKSSEDDSIRIIISSQGRIGLTFVFLLGCLPLYGKAYSKVVQVLVTHKIYRLLAQINIIDFYKNDKSSNDPYKIVAEDLLKQPAFKKIEAAEDIIPFVQDIRMEVPLKLSPDMEAMLVSMVGEMYQNALEHANANIVVGGKYFKNQKNKYCFSCYDNGVGIPGNVNSFFESKGEFKISDADAIKWALKKGTSTNEVEGIPRGVGLDLLRSFAISNGGVIRICSGKALYVLNRGEEKYFKLKNTFYGTLFEMDLFSVPVQS